MAQSRSLRTLCCRSAFNGKHTRLLRFSLSEHKLKLEDMLMPANISHPKSGLSPLCLQSFLFLPHCLVSLLPDGTETPPNTEDQPRMMRTTVVKLDASGHEPHWDLMKLRMDVGGGFRGNALIWEACAELWAGAGRIWSQKQTTKPHAAKLLQTSRWTKLMSALLSFYWMTFFRRANLQLTGQMRG